MIALNQQDDSSCAALPRANRIVQVSMLLPVFTFFEAKPVQRLLQSANQE